jgi:hypothetical protein
MWLIGIWVSWADNARAVINARTGPKRLSRGRTAPRTAAIALRGRGPARPGARGQCIAVGRRPSPLGGSTIHRPLFRTTTRPSQSVTVTNYRERRRMQRCDRRANHSPVASNERVSATQGERSHPLSANQDSGPAQSDRFPAPESAASPPRHTDPMRHCDELHCWSTTLGMTRGMDHAGDTAIRLAD